MRAVLVPFSGKVNATMMLEASFRFARENGSHLTCLHLLNDPDKLGGMFDEMALYTPGSAQDESTRLSQKMLQQAKRSFAAVAEYMEMETGEGKKCSFLHEHGNFEEAIIRRGRLSDVIFMRQTGEDQTPEQDVALHAALFGTSKPVIIVPERKIHSIGHNIAIAWSESRESALALHHAMPLLKNAKRVTLLVGQKSSKDAAASSKPVLSYLARHGIKAKYEPVITENHMEEAILTKCGEIGADLLVMGAFSHHRIRQLILGGMTKYMLKHADIPLFMAH